MYHYPVALLRILLLLTLSAVVTSGIRCQAGPRIIDITPEMVLQLTGGDQTAAALFDGDINTPWFPGWNPSDYPARCRIDLGDTLFIDSIRIYDGSGRPDFYIAFANGINEVPTVLHRITLHDYQSWQTLPVRRALRYMYLTLVQPLGDAQVMEVILTETDTTTIPPYISRGEADKINLCGFHWVPLDSLTPFRSLRMYLPSGWIWRPRGLFVEPPFQAQANILGFDSYFADAKRQNLQILPVINQTPDWYGGVSSGLGSNDHPPLKSGESRTDPASYEAFAEFLFQFTARYGNVTYPDSRLTVDTMPRWTNDPPNTLKSGLGVIEQIEVWNEPNKSWLLGGPDALAFIRPDEYAAMLSISYDSIKSADPSIKVVMAGLAGMNLDYLDTMKTWFENNRADGKFAADVINVHHYSNLAYQGPPPHTLFNAGGMCPELDGNFQTVQDIVAFAKNLGKEIWLTEFGYDTYEPSWQSPSPVPGFTNEELQAQWLARSYLEFLRYGVDNMYMYNAIDEPTAINGGLYQSSGIMHGSGHIPAFEKKISYHTLEELIDQLSYTTYEADKSTSNVRIMSFRKADGGERIIYWSPTMEDAKVDFSISGTPVLTATEWPQYFDIN